MNKNPFPLDKTASEWCKENIGDNEMKDNPEETQEQNALIESVSIGIERGAFLVAWLHLKLQDGFNQGFGGNVLYLSKSCTHHTMQSLAGHFIYRVLEIAEVENWNQLKGKTIRIRKKKSWGSTIDAIGHIIKDDWFSPEKDFKDVTDEIYQH